MATVVVPALLRKLTDGKERVTASGRNVGQIIADLDRQFPGIRFRVVDEQSRLRKHMKVFVNQENVRDLATPLAGVEEVTIMQALSGGCGR